MKRHYFLIFLLFGFLATNAQIINIPDANFKAKLLAASPASDIAIDALNNQIKIDINDDGEIQQSEALVVFKLNVYDSNISDLTGVTNFTNLVLLNADHNQLTTVTLAGLSNLTWLRITENSSLTSVSLSNLNSLRMLELFSNQLSSLTLNGLSNLYGVYCNSNNLTSIDLSGTPMIEQVDFSQNQLTSITFPDFTSVNNPYEFIIQLDHNLLEMVTLPNHLIGGFSCNNNPNLTYLNMKEGIRSVFNPNLSEYHFSNCPALEYICVRDEDVTAAQGNISLYGYTNCHVNTYCSFNPGGTYYTIQGTNTFDSNSNGCDSNDTLVPNMKYLISQGTITTTLIAGTDGLFHYDVSAGNYTITPLLENAADYTISPASAMISFPATSSPFMQDFCVTPNSIHNDLEVVMFPITGARPGFDTTHKIIYKNKGTQTQNGTVGLTFNDSVLDLVSASPTIETQATNSLLWNFSNLQPFETREILITFNVNSPLETPPVNEGNVLVYTAEIVGSTDETPADNTAAFLQTVVNSLDPNDKACIEGSTITPSMVGQYVHYVIRFENTGTANAENIVVKDVIDTTKFDIATLVPLDGSAPYVTRIINTNQVEFIFENVSLPFDDANNDGYVAFKIKTKPTLVVGNTFSNTANIYFDYNAPIVTNTATTTVQLLGNTDFDFGSVFSLSPVPAKNTLTITAKQMVTMSSVSIYNTLGQLVQVITNPNGTIDVSGLKTGTYFIKILSDKGSTASKFIKE